MVESKAHHLSLLVSVSAKAKAKNRGVKNSLAVFCLLLPPLIVAGYFCPNRMGPINACVHVLNAARPCPVSKVCFLGKATCRLAASWGILVTLSGMIPAILLLKLLTGCKIVGVSGAVVQAARYVSVM